MCEIVLKLQNLIFLKINEDINMKKLVLLTLALTFSLNTIMVKKAEAGLIVAGVVVIASANINENIGGILGLSGMAVAATSSILFITQKIPLSIFRPIYYIGLEADGSIPQVQLVQNFSSRYSFVDNNQLIVSLVGKIKSKFEANKTPEQELTMVNFSEKELEDHFAGAELTDEEMSLIKADLI